MPTQPVEHGAARNGGSLPRRERGFGRTPSAPELSGDRWPRHICISPVLVDAVQARGDAGNHEWPDYGSGVCVDDREVRGVAAQPHAAQVWREHIVADGHGDIAPRILGRYGIRGRDHRHAALGERFGNRLRGATGSDHQYGRLVVGCGATEGGSETGEKRFEAGCPGTTRDHLEPRPAHPRCQRGQHPFFGRGHIVEAHEYRVDADLQRKRVTPDEREARVEAQDHDRQCAPLWNPQRQTVHRL